MSTRAHRLPVVDLARSIAGDQRALEEAAVRVLRGGRFVLGPEVAAFEREAAAFLGVPHAVGVSSGTDALYLALRAIGIGPGDEVIVPVFGFVATAEAVVRTGARPTFVDVRSACGRMDLAAAAQRLSPAVKALVYVPLGGDAGGSAEAASFCAHHGITLVEDAAQSFGARDQDRPSGTFGAIAAFSFFPAKILGGFGDGGLVVTADEALAARVRSLRQHGRTEDGRFDSFGANARLDELQAALLRVRLASLPCELEHRAHLATRYDEALLRRGLAQRTPCAGACTAHARTDAPVLLPARCAPGHAHGLYTVRLRSTADRDHARATLAAAGVDSAVYYARLLADEPCFGAFASVSAAFLGARDLASRTLTLPFFVGMDDADIERVATALAFAFASV